MFPEASVDVPPDRGRGDACPGALRLHLADDGALARVRVPGGILTVRQAGVLGRAAEELGDGRLDLTSRGNVQLRGLSSECGGVLGEWLRGAGLLPSEPHERVRNIVVSPLSGLDGAGHADVQPWASAFDALLCRSAVAAGLSGRFLFAFDDGRGDVTALDADVTLIAERSGTALLYVGGDGPALRIDAGDAPGAALRAAEEFLALAEGVWRVRELPDGGRELRRRLGARAAQAAPRRGDPPRAGTAAGGRALCVAVPLGRMTVAQWRTLIAHASYGMRLTPWRGVVLPGAPADAAGALAEAGFVTGAGSPWQGVGACTGRPGCAKSLADVRADAEDAVRHQPPGAGDLLPVYWSGCERRCGHPTGRWVDVTATGEGYRIRVDRATPQLTGTQQETAAAVAAARAQT